LDDNEQAYEKNRRIEIKLTTRWKKLKFELVNWLLANQNFIIKKIQVIYICF
jgi:hypothetical protein